jgi:hypothetical protein
MGFDLCPLMFPELNFGGEPWMRLCRGYINGLRLNRDEVMGQRLPSFSVLNTVVGSSSFMCNSHDGHEGFFLGARLRAGIARG